MKKITPHLWFNREAKEAAEFYCSVFSGSKVTNVTTLHDTPSGTVNIVSFELSGQPFMAISAGPLFKFNEAISFMVHCNNQEEIDYYWDRLSADGDSQAQQCGWLKDKFGLSWQVVPTVLIEMLTDKDTAKAKCVMHAVLQMDKIDIAVLKNAYDQK